MTDPTRATVSQPEPDVDDILQLAAIIRRVDGNNSLGAAALAEKILSHPNSRWTADRAHRQPEPGEVQELVEWLRADTTGSYRTNQCAADLLERLSPLQPVPMSERLQGPELCWWYEPDEDDDGSGYGGSWTLLRIRGNTVSYTHWLPAHALPVPAND